MGVKWKYAHSVSEQDERGDSPRSFRSQTSKAGGKLAGRFGENVPLYGNQTARQKAGPGASWLVTVAVVLVRVTVALEVQVFRLGDVWS